LTEPENAVIDAETTKLAIERVRKLAQQRDTYIEALEDVALDAYTKRYRRLIQQREAMRKLRAERKATKQ
jgi:hypothetical protein